MSFSLRGRSRDITETTIFSRIKCDIRPLFFNIYMIKSSSQDLKDMDILCTFKIKMEGQNFEHGCIKNHWPYQIQDQDVIPQSGSSSILQNPKSGLKGHGCCLHLQNQDREQKFGIWVYQRPVTISKSISWCQTPARNPYQKQNKIPNFSQEHPVSSKGPYHDLKDMVVFMSSKSR